MSISFIEALKSGDQEGIISAEKSDLHSHAGKSGRPAWLASRLNKEVPLPPEKFESLGHMQEWFNTNIKTLFSQGEGNVLRWEAGFAEAKRNHIKRLACSFGTPDIALVGGMEKFMSILNTFHETYCPDTVFEPEIAYSTRCDALEESKRLSEYLEYGFFKSIDMNCGENVQPFQAFVPLYRKAEEYGLTKRIHVGETGSAEDMLEAIEVLGLDEIHHGVAAASSREVMRILADRKITLHICPSSNVMLRVTESYETHPIRTLVENGVAVTINTDDLLIFNQSIDMEYVHLYQAGVLSAEELDAIRMRGLEFKK